MIGAGPAVLTLLVAALQGDGAGPKRAAGTDATTGRDRVQAAEATGRARDPNDSVLERSLLSKVLQRAIAKAAPSVVTVETFGGTRRSTTPGRPRAKKPRNGGLGPLRLPGFQQAQGTSTGLVVGADGWILTTRFVLNWRPTTIIVTLADGRKFTARTAGEDRTRGIALLKIDAGGLPVPEIVPRSQMRVGQWVFALGRTFGPRTPTAHAGILSAVGRLQGKAVQCDAYTSPANYGGPLIDLEGRVLGIVAPLSPRGDMAGAEWYDSGIGFAVVLDGIDRILAGMKKGEVYRRPFLGVRLDPGFLGPGAKILSVERGSPAHEAGLRKGDLVTAVDGVPSRHAMHLQDQIGAHTAGDLIEISFTKKDGTKGRVLVELAPRKES